MTAQLQEHAEGASGLAGKDWESGRGSARPRGNLMSTRGFNNSGQETGYLTTTTTATKKQKLLLFLC